MNHNNNDFHYAPIDCEKHEFRLLLLSPESTEKSIFGALIHHSLSDYPSFDALSYTWGQGLTNRPINLDGQTFWVTRNLYGALQRIRRPGEEMYVWIDAICINQRDIPERNAHIVYMHHLYSFAECVLVWLGEGREQSDLAIEILKHFSPMSELKIRWKNSMSDQSERAYWTSIARFFSRPWWTRVWTLQEIVWANKVLIFWGASTIDWETMLSGYSRMDGFLNRPRLLLSQVQDIGRATAIPFISRYRELRETNSMVSLMHTLSFVRIRECTDPRDRIFGLLNIMPVPEWPFLPDYNQSTVSVYTKLAEHVISKYRRLDLLRLCERPDSLVREEHLRAKFRSKSIPGIPSWVPDWSWPRQTAPLIGGFEVLETSDDTSHIRRYTTSRHTPAKFEFISQRPVMIYETSRTIPAGGVSNEGKVLSAAGYVYDHIKEVSGPRPISGNGHEIPTRETLVSFKEQMMKAVAASDWYRDHRHNSENIFWRCLLANRTEAGVVPKSNYCQSLMSWMATSHQPSSIIPSEVQRRIVKVCHSRQLITTEKGLVGFAPYPVHPGDLVCVLLGCDTPLILRQTQLIFCPVENVCKSHELISECMKLGCMEKDLIVESERRTILIGEAYVHGIMEGEALGEGEMDESDLEQFEIW